MYTEVKQTTSLLLLNNFYPVISYRQVQKKKKEKKKRKRRIVVHGSVTRYGPRESPDSRKKERRSLSVPILKHRMKCHISLDLEWPQEHLKLYALSLSLCLSLWRVIFLFISRVWYFLFSLPLSLSPVQRYIVREPRPRRAGRNPQDNKRTSRAFVYFHRMRQTFVISLYLRPAPANKGSNAWRLEIFLSPLSYPSQSLSLSLSLSFEDHRSYSLTLLPRSSIFSLPTLSFLMGPYQGARRPINRIVTFSQSPL